MPSVTLTIQTLNLVMGYLAKQPWENVNSIIETVHSEVGPQVAPKQVEEIEEIEESDQSIGGTD